MGNHGSLCVPLFGGETHVMAPRGAMPADQGRAQSRQSERAQKVGNG